MGRCYNESIWLDRWLLWKVFPDMLLEDVNQTGQPEASDANSRSDWLPFKVRMSSMLWACWELYSKGRMQASLRIPMSTPKHLITCVYSLRPLPDWSEKLKKHKNKLNPLFCQLSDLKCASPHSKFRNFWWGKTTIWGDQAWQKWWWGRKISVFLHNFYHFFFPYVEGQRQYHLKGRFSNTKSLDYICKRQKIRTEGRERTSWKGMLPFSVCRCNLGSEYRNYLSFVTKGSQDQKRLALSKNVLPCDYRMTKYIESTSQFMGFLEVIFLKCTLLDIISMTNGSGFAPWIESACKGGSDIKLAF